ncbi:flagellar hook-associated protein 3 [Sphingomonas turrisvirgatae]|uniref:Flagellar hook-associated protein 3 n=1 Tax=Sphingomonas turrisvirgatae TaxID=1888892 RepID=A0A1E3LZF8_9SPHN|nr:flagellar hook-associated protein 3 [Sphingomonas turrisvirgatae]
MRVTTAQRFDRPSLMMAGLNKQADTLQTQIATGSKIAAPSDSATGWQQLSGLKRAGADDKAYDANIKTAQALLGETESALDAVTTQLQRAKAFAVQANNGTLPPEARASILKDVEAIITDLLGVANRQDSRGHPLFGGATGDTAFARQDDGSIAYVGGEDGMSIPIGDGQSIAATETGARAFGGIAGKDGETDMFAILASLAAALAPGAEADAIETAMDDLDVALSQVETTRASIGARAFRLDLEAERVTDAGIAREARRSGIEDVDTSEAITQLQKTLTVLQATQASFTKLTSLSLFDYLR